MSGNMGMATQPGKLKRMLISVAEKGIDAAAYMYGRLRWLKNKVAEGRYAVLCVLSLAGLIIFTISCAALDIVKEVKGEGHASYGNGTHVLMTTSIEAMSNIVQPTTGTFTVLPLGRDLHHPVGYLTDTVVPAYGLSTTVSSLTSPATATASLGGSGHHGLSVTSTLQLMSTASYVLTVSSLGNLSSVSSASQPLSYASYHYALSANPVNPIIPSEFSMSSAGVPVMSIGSSTDDEGSTTISTISPTATETGSSSRAAVSDIWTPMTGYGTHLSASSGSSSSIPTVTRTLDGTKYCSADKVPATWYPCGTILSSSGSLSIITTSFSNSQLIGTPAITPSSSSSTSAASSGRNNPFSQVFAYLRSLSGLNNRYSDGDESAEHSHSGIVENVTQGKRDETTGKGINNDLTIIVVVNNTLGTQTLPLKGYAPAVLHINLENCTSHNQFLSDGNRDLQAALRACHEENRDLDAKFEGLLAVLRLMVFLWLLHVAVITFKCWPFAGGDQTDVRPARAFEVSRTVLWDAAAEDEGEDLVTPYDDLPLRH